MRGGRTVRAWLLASMALAGACTSATDAAPDPRGPSSGATPAATPAATPSTGATSAYDRAVLADRPLAYWPLSGATASSTTVLDLVPGNPPAQVIGGSLRPTDGPPSAGAAAGGVAFTGGASLRSDLRGVLEPGRPFTLQLQFRADGCSEDFRQVVGTATFGDDGRGGVNVLHYPRKAPSPCGLSIEFWGRDAYTGGCGTPGPAVAGRWSTFTAAYDGAAVACYVDGSLVGGSPVGRFTADEAVPFGIGASGDPRTGVLDSASLAGVAVFDRALPPARVAAHAVAAGLATPPSTRPGG